MYRIIIASLLILLGAALGIGGVWLILLDGSWFYALLGVAILVCGALIWSRHPAGLSLYGLTLLATLGWSPWEAGLDWWALAPRGGLLVVLGILLLPLGFAWKRQRHLTHGKRVAGPAAVLAFALVIAAATGGIAMLNDPHRIAGSFPDTAPPSADATAYDGAEPGEWPAYGRTNYGRRYSPLTAITPENVADLEVAWTYNSGQARVRPIPARPPTRSRRL